MAGTVGLGDGHAAGIARDQRSHRAAADRSAAVVTIRSRPGGRPVMSVSTADCRNGVGGVLSRVTHRHGTERRRFRVTVAFGWVNDAIVSIEFLLI